MTPFRTLAIAGTLYLCAIHPCLAGDEYTEVFLGAGGMFDASPISVSDEGVTVNSKQDGAAVFEAGVIKRADRVISYGAQAMFRHGEMDARQEGATGESHSVNELTGVAVVRLNAAPQNASVNGWIGGRLGGAYSRHTVECDPKGEGCTPMEKDDWRMVYGPEVGVEFCLTHRTRVQFVAAHERDDGGKQRNIVSARLALRF